MQKLIDRIRNITVAELICGGVCAVLILAALLRLGGVMAGASEYDAQTLAKEAELGQLRSELNVVEETEEETSTEAETIADIRTRYSAQSAGTQIASLQTNYVVLVPDASITASEEAARENIRETLLSFFESGSENGAESWFDPVSTYQSGNTARFTWSFESSYQYAGRTLPVMWLCRYDGDQVVAYVTGVYHSETELFSDISVHITSTGQAAMGMNTNEAYDARNEIIYGTEEETEAVSDNDIEEAAEVSEEGAFYEDVPGYAEGTEVSGEGSEDSSYEDVPGYAEGTETSSEAERSSGSLEHDSESSDLREEAERESESRRVTTGDSGIPDNFFVD